jgi:hypothetical protein
MRAPLQIALAMFLAGIFDASASVLYVSVSSINPVPPYTNWDSAATNIQDAVNLAQTGDTVLVTNGIYATGGLGWFGSRTNRVTLTQAVTLQSVNGPAVTFIVGSKVGAGLSLTNAVRCVAIGGGAVLSGFTLTNGEAGNGNYPSGGGVIPANGISPAGTVTNCVLVGNLATNSVGGGAYRVTLIDCQITGNSAGSGGGACSCTLINCTVVSNTAASGGGIFGGSVYGPCLLTNCILTGNSATNGGGAYGGSLNNCLITSNSAASRGGGTYSATLSSCTVVANSSSQQGGGVDESQTLLNSVIYYNSAPFGTNINGGGAFTNCCTTPLPGYGANNLTNAPLFLNLNGGDFHLQSNSPCINAGDNAYVATSTDLDGNPRIKGGTVDMGAYELQNPSSVISYAWLQSYGLPTDGSADFIDSDGNGMNNRQKWIAGLNPTNAASVLKMLAATNSVSGQTITWLSVNNRAYSLQRSTNLLVQPAFSTIQTNIQGQAGTTTFIDTNADGTGPYFYRVQVQQ